MANGLFMSPDQIRALQSAQRAQSLGGRSPVEGALFNAGRGLGNVARRGFGGQDTRSVEEQRAAGVHEAVSGLDFSNRENMIQRIRNLSAQGFIEEAQTLAKALPDLPAQAPVTETFTIDGKTHMVRTQVDKEGKQQRVFQISGPNPQGTGSRNINVKGIEMTEEIRQLLTSKLNSAEGFESMFTNLDVDDTANLFTELGGLADEMKVRDAILGNPQVTNRMYANRAFTKFMNDGLVHKYVKEAAVGAPNIQNPPELMDLESLENARRQTAEAKAVRDRLPEPIPGNSNLGQFNRENISMADATGALLAGGPEKTRVALAERGITMTPEAYSSHAPYFDMANQNKTFVQKYLNAPTQNSGDADYIAELRKATGQRREELIHLKKYLDMMPRAKKELSIKDRILQNNFGMGAL